MVSIIIIIVEDIYYSCDVSSYGLSVQYNKPMILYYFFFLRKVGRDRVGENVASAEQNFRVGLILPFSNKKSFFFSGRKKKANLLWVGDEKNQQNRYPQMWSESVQVLWIPIL